MARVLPQALIRLSSSPSSSPTTPSAILCWKSASEVEPFSGRVVPRRYRSHQSGKGQLMEVEVESSSSSEVSEVEMVGLRKLDDVIHRIIAQRAAPAWLPFIPGSSYWVPPKRPFNVIDLVGKLANPLSEEESMALTTARGWPSSAYFIHGSVSAHTVAVVEVEVQPDPDNTPQSVDQE